MRSGWLLGAMAAVAMGLHAMHIVRQWRRPPPPPAPERIVRGKPRPWLLPVALLVQLAGVGLAIACALLDARRDRASAAIVYAAACLGITTLAATLSRLARPRDPDGFEQFMIHFGFVVVMAIGSCYGCCLGSELRGMFTGPW
ncbi:MAG: hypothetical protein JNK15_02440 [Planctomycetes bacterium]|nr:hypothetical protein [Planctomycetota bacterium]